MPPGAATGVPSTSVRCTEDAIAAALASRGAGTVDARIAAAATIGVLSAALLEWADGDDPDLGTAIHAAQHVLSRE
jgi:hypothetical protein